MEKSQKSNLKQKTYKYSFDILGKGSELASQKIDDILNYFNIDYRYSGDTILGKCPIHDGDNNTAFNMYPNQENPCAWVCNTANCHTKYRNNIYGFVHGMLSKKQPTTYEQAIDWVMEFVELSNNNYTENKNYTSHTRFGKFFKIKKEIYMNKDWTREKIRKQLIIPSEYYLKRKYSANILSKYDVGLNQKIGRVYIPIYDNDYKFVVGFTSRSQYEKCPKCNKYHNTLAQCPKDDNKIYSKWVNSPQGFNKSNFLFNYWFAKPYLKKDSMTILVEGPGDVLKLEDNNIHHSVATFGLSLSEEQKISLERLGVTKIICLYDNDEAGKQAKMNLELQLKRSFNLEFPQFNSSDIGEASPEELLEIKNYIY
jgi:5S rRNA maturation endonuclease (ribonuclease M5)